MSAIYNLRETTEGRPAPGDYDGLTRAGILTQLLSLHQEPPCEHSRVARSEMSTPTSWTMRVISLLWRSKRIPAI